MMTHRAAVLLRLNEAARRNGWIITRSEALNLGATRQLIAELVATGVWRRYHPGVYVVGGVPHTHVTAVRAAMVALGSGTVASHQSAAWIMGVIDRPPTVVHVMVTWDFARSMKGVKVHRATGALRRRLFEGVACTEPARMLVDLAATERPDRVAAAVDGALAMGLVRLRDLEAECDRLPRRGVAKLRRTLKDRGYLAAPTPSVLESHMGRLIVRNRLPSVRAEVVAGPDGEYRIDYAYLPQKLAIEVHGYTWHHSPEQMARDLARQRALTLDGWTVLVYTWQDVVYHGARVAAEIAVAHARLSRALPASSR